MWLLGFIFIVSSLFVMAILVSVFNLDNSILSFFIQKIWIPFFMCYALIYWLKTDIIDKRKDINKSKKIKKDTVIKHNEITQRIISLIGEELKETLSDVKQDEYEENGKIYYMNGQNGTFFDWTVNGRLPYFMVFYKDGSCGSVKVNIKTNGDTELYFYKYGENNPFITKTTKFDKDEILKLAIILMKETDNQNIFDIAINDINTNIIVTKKDMEMFDILKNKNYINDINRQKSDSNIEQSPIKKKLYTYKGKNFLTTDGIEEEIKLFEKQIGKIPSELKKFWMNEGYGFISEHEDGVPFKRLLSPSEIIDFISRSDNYGWVPDSDFYTSIQDKGFVIMEYDEYNYFWIGTQSDNLGKVFWLEEEICNSFNELIKKLENDEDVFECVRKN